MQKYKFISKDNELEIQSFDKNGDFIDSFKFNSLSTTEKNHKLPFDIQIISDKDLSEERELIINPVNVESGKFLRKLSVETLGKESDQLIIRLTHTNKDIAVNYLNNLVKYFDLDGIKDRELEYRRTIDFVNVREKILKEELGEIEIKKQNYGQENKMANIEVDAGNGIDLKYSYNSEIFQLNSQKQIIEYLVELVEKSDYEYLPINVG